MSRNANVKEIERLDRSLRENLCDGFVLRHWAREVREQTGAGLSRNQAIRQIGLESPNYRSVCRRAFVRRHGRRITE